QNYARCCPARSTSGRCYHTLSCGACPAPAAGPFSSRFSLRFPGLSAPSPLAGEGAKRPLRRRRRAKVGGGGPHGLGTSLAFTPTLALPCLRRREKTDRRGAKKLNDPEIRNLTRYDASCTV